MVRRSYLGTWSTITLASAADLFVRWWPQLRRCKHTPCQAWFLPTHGRQRYHDARCAAKARYERFKPKRGYKTEYSRRYDSTRTSLGANHQEAGNDYDMWAKGHRQDRQD